MIERLSSNHISSHPRNTEISIPSIQEQENSVGVLPETQLEEAVESVTFPKEKVEEIIASMNRFMQASPTSLKFEFHEKLNEYYVKIIDDVTQEVVKEIPPKKMLDFYAAMTEFLGLMVDKKV